MSPLITVIFPLFNLRGETASVVASWTKQQTLSRERFRVVVACPDDPVAFPHDKVRALVGEGGDIVTGPTGSDGALWNVGAAHASTEWLVFTEGHCQADPGCLAAVDAWLRSGPVEQAGNFAVGHYDTSLQARLSDRWFGELQQEWRKDWRRLHRAGFVVRADLFHAVCGFVPEYGEFAVPMLSALLAERGVAVADVPGAAVIHNDDEDMAGHHAATSNYSSGEALARSRSGVAFFEHYFGYNVVWGNQLREHASVAGPMMRAMARTMAAQPRLALFLAGRLAKLAARRMVSRTARASLLDGLVKFDEVVVERLPLPKDFQYRRFLSAHARVVRREYMRWVARRPVPLSPRGFGVWPAATLTPGDVVGVHGIEHHDGRSFRWSEPVFLLPLAEQTQDCELHVDTGELRGDPLGYVAAVMVGDDLLPADRLTSRGGTLVIRVPKERAAAGQLVVICNPLRAPRDPRALGLPIFAVERRSA